MNRPIPLWCFLFCLLVWVLVTVVFGWLVLSDSKDRPDKGIIRTAAVQIASFPSETKEVILQLISYYTGSYKDEKFRVARAESPHYADFKKVSARSGIDVEGLLMRADPGAMAEGWRLLVGAFSFDGEVENAALLMSPELEIVRRWILDEDPADGLEPAAKYRKLIHGVEILDDGSLIFAFDDGVSLQRVDACGKRQWVTGGLFHHAVTLDDGGESVWTFSGVDTIAQVAVADGTIMREISMDEVIARNPMIDILEIRRKHRNDQAENSRNTAGRWLPDRFHLNDVDPLPADLADRFDGFDAGDLLVSARSLNLLFVLDPDTLEVKWWRVGAMQRQHDPDWAPNGEIMALNNRMSRDFSEIASINPRSFERTTVFDGRKNNFYTRVRGKQQMLPSGALEVTSPQQGRAFEVNSDGDIVLEIVNQKPDSDNINYVISEMRWLPSSRFDGRQWECT
jgi:Arylsulfotransferase (ASST)